MAEEETPAVEAEVVAVEAVEAAEDLAQPAAEEPEVAADPEVEAVIEPVVEAKKPLNGKKIKAEVEQPAAVAAPAPVAAQEYALPSVTHGVAGSTHIAVSHRNR